MKLVWFFLSHQLKKTRRSTIWQKSVVLNIILVLVALLLIAEAVGISLLLAYKWHEIAKEGEILSSFYEVMAYFFVGMLSMRFFMQQLPAMEIVHYQNLPIRKSTLVNFLLIKGKFNFFTFLTLIFVTPFAFLQVAYYHGNALALLWLIGMMVIDLTINYFIFYVKKQMVSNLKVVAFLLAIIALMVGGELLKWYSFSGLFAQTITALMAQPVLWLIPFILLLLMYYVDYRFLRNRLYLEEIGSKKTEMVQGNRFNYLRRFGLIGEVMLLDIKLFMRNKRTKTILFLTPIFLCYGFLFYPNDEYSRDGGFMIFVGMFISGFLMLNYLQHAFSYEGSYFDLLLSSGINFRDYIQSKMVLASVVVVLCYLVTLPYFFFGTEILLINTATFLFNLGFIIPLILYMATYNTKSMVLTRGSAFNYQGMSATHWLVVLPVFVLPLFIYLPFKWFGNATLGLIVLGSIGIISLFFRSFYIDQIHQQLTERKYKMSSGFREKN